MVHLFARYLFLTDLQVRPSVPLGHVTECEGEGVRWQGRGIGGEDLYTHFSII